MAKQPKRRALRGKGPTPKAENRPNHKRYRDKDDSSRKEFGRKRTERKRIDSNAAIRSAIFVVSRGSIMTLSPVVTQSLKPCELESRQKS